MIHSQNFERKKYNKKRFTIHCGFDQHQRFPRNFRFLLWNLVIDDCRLDFTCHTNNVIWLASLLACPCNVWKRTCSRCRETSRLSVQRLENKWFMLSHFRIWSAFIRQSFSFGIEIELGRLASFEMKLLGVDW